MQEGVNKLIMRYRELLLLFHLSMALNTGRLIIETSMLPEQPSIFQRILNIIDNTFSLVTDAIVYNLKETEARCSISYSYAIAVFIITGIIGVLVLKCFLRLFRKQKVIVK